MTEFTHVLCHGHHQSKLNFYDEWLSSEQAFTSTHTHKYFKFQLLSASERFRWTKKKNTFLPVVWNRLICTTLTLLRKRFTMKMVRCAVNNYIQLEINLEINQNICSVECSMHSVVLRLLQISRILDEMGKKSWNSIHLSEIVDLEQVNEHQMHIIIITSVPLND